MTNKRYFLVWFSGQTRDEENEPRSGRVEFAIEGGYFINEQDTIEQIEEAFDIDFVFIKNILEVSEDDFLAFTAGRPEKNEESNSPEMGDFI